MRQLRRQLDSTVAPGRQWKLPLQRLRALLQDERDQPPFGQAQELESGTVFEIFFLATSSHGGQSTVTLNTDFLAQNFSILMLLK